MESWRNRKTLILSRTDMMGLLTAAMARVGEQHRRLTSLPHRRSAVRRVTENEAGKSSE
jgi:hypothetical protein